MARGIGVIEGWPAIAWVGGMGAGLLLSAGVLWLRARSFRDERAAPPTYRSAGASGSSRGAEMRALAVLMVSLCVLSQLLYAGLHVELVQWLLGARERPHIEGELFFWVLLVNGTCAGGALYSTWRKSP